MLLSLSTQGSSAGRTPLIGIAACLVGFAVVAFCAYSVPRLEQADAAALAGLFQIGNTRIELPAHLIARTGDLLPWLSALTVLAWCGMRWGRGRPALAAGGAALVAVALSQVLKLLLAHPRTQAVVGNHTLGPEALPSGHTTAAMSVAVMAVLCAPHDLRRWVAGLGALYAWAMAVSVIVLAWHLPSDAMAAMFLAAGCGFASILISPHLPVGLDGRRRPAPGPVLAIAYLLVIAGIAAFIVAMVLGGERAGRALTYAHAHRSAVVAMIALGLTALALTLSLASAASAHRDDADGGT